MSVKYCKIYKFIIIDWMTDVKYKISILLGLIFIHICHAHLLGTCGTREQLTWKIT